MQKLHHEACESLESPGNADRGGYLDQHAFGCMDVNLESAGLVDW